MVDSCLSDDQIASLSLGLLDDEERLAAERHIDGCPACSELVLGLGRAYSPSTPVDATPKPAAARRPTASEINAWFQLSQAAIWLTVFVLSAYLPAVDLDARLAVLPPTALLVTAWSLVNGWALWHRARWATVSTLILSALLALSVISTVHSSYALATLRSRNQ